MIASLEWDLGQAGKQLEALEHAFDHAGRARASFETAEAFHSVTAAIVRGPIPVPDGIARAEAILREFPDNRGAEAYMSHALAHLWARLGEFDQARVAVDRYRGFMFDTGQLMAYWRSAELQFDVEMLAGDVQAAADVAEEAHAKLSERGDRWPYLCAFLAQARIALGRTRRPPRSPRSPRRAPTPSNERWAWACSRAPGEGGRHGRSSGADR